MGSACSSTESHVAADNVGMTHAYTPSVRFGNSTTNMDANSDILGSGYTGKRAAGQSVTFGDETAGSPDSSGYICVIGGTSIFNRSGKHGHDTTAHQSFIPMQGCSPAVAVEDLLDKMRHGLGLSGAEMDIVEEISKLGEPYRAGKHAHGLMSSKYDSDVGGSFYFPVQELHGQTSSGNDGENAGYIGGVEGSDVFAAIAYMSEEPGNEKSLTRGASKYRSLRAKSDASVTQTVNDDSVSETSYVIDSVKANDPNLARRIQEGNRLVQSTWAYAYATPDFAIKLLQRQHKLNPALSDAVFYKVNPAKQADKLGNMINESIQMLDKPDAFIPIMMQLGVKHVMYGVTDEHLDVFREALFEMLKEMLKPPLPMWSDDLAREWKRTFALMKSMMMQGRSLPQGQKEVRRYKAQTHRMLLRCWRSVVDREDTGLETSFVEILHKTGESYIGEGRLALFSNLVARRRMFMDLVTKLFEIGLDDSEAVQLLRELGARHVSYGLTKEDYVAYTEPFVTTVVACAQPSTINPLVKHLMRQFWKRCTALMLEGSAESRCSFALRLAPKAGPLAIVFTDIESSTTLWENQPVPMETAVDNHHKLLRDLIHDHNGYEVKTIGDSFMIAFKSLSDAVTMAMRIQVDLLGQETEGLVVDGSNCEASGPARLWNDKTVRVRVGVHWCNDVAPKFDVVHKRYDYYGNDVNISARVQDAACGGQVVCTAETLKALQGMVGQLEEPNTSCTELLTIRGKSQQPSSQPTAMMAKVSLGEVLESTLYLEDAALKGVNDPVTLYSLYPKVLRERAFGKRKKNVFN